METTKHVQRRSLQTRTKQRTDVQCVHLRAGGPLCSPKSETLWYAYTQGSKKHRKPKLKKPLWRGCLCRFGVESSRYLRGTETLKLSYLYVVLERDRPHFSTPLSSPKPYTLNPKPYTLNPEPSNKSKGPLEHHLTALRGDHLAHVYPWLGFRLQSGCSFRSKAWVSCFGFRIKVAGFRFRIKIEGLEGLGFRIKVEGLGLTAYGTVGLEVQRQGCSFGPWLLLKWY